MDDAMMKQYQEICMDINIENILDRIIRRKEENLVVNLGIGSFEFDSEHYSVFFRPKRSNRRYEGTGGDIISFESIVFYRTGADGTAEIQSPTMRKDILKSILMWTGITGDDLKELLAQYNQPGHDRNHRMGLQELPDESKVLLILSGMILEDMRTRHEYSKEDIKKSYDWLETCIDGYFGRHNKRTDDDLSDCMNPDNELFESLKLHGRAAYELAKIRSEPASCSRIDYKTSTYIGPPTMSGESCDADLMRYLLQKYPDKIVFAGDFITGFGMVSDCFFEKIVEVHSLPYKTLRDTLKEGLLLRKEEYSHK